jgi:hypothetical protein
LIKTDSQVIAGQVKKEYMARGPKLIKYLAIVRALERRFILRLENLEADELVKAMANGTPMPTGTFFQILKSQAT